MYMPKLVSHVSDNAFSKIYSGEREATQLVYWLNLGLLEHEDVKRVRKLVEESTGHKFHHREAQSRVIHILRLYKQACEEWEQITSEGPQYSTDKRTNAAPSKSPTRPPPSAFKRLRSCLRRYTFYP